MRMLMAVGFVLAASGCATQDNAAAAQPRSQSPVSGAAELPLSVAWEPGELGTGGVELIATIEVRGRFPSPIRVEVKTPAGARLVKGEAVATLPASDGPARYRMAYRFAYESVPSQDAVLVVDAQGGGFGAHAEKRYGFGRPAPVPARVEANGPALQVGNHNLGNSVPLTADPKPAPKKP